MDTLTTAFRQNEPINLITGVFLKSVYFLDQEFTKCLVSGIFINRDSSLGVLIKGKKGIVFWTYDSYCQLVDRLNEITLAMLGNYQCSITLDTGANIKIIKVYGHQYAYVSDGEHTLALNSREWNQLLIFVPTVSRVLLELFYLEDLIKIFISNILSDSDYSPNQLPPHIVETLFREVNLYKYCLHDGCGS
jgi:hypothetical protein